MMTRATKKPVKPAAKAKKPPAKPGRKPKYELDPTLMNTIVQYIEQGLTHEMAFSQAGLSKAAFYRYLKVNQDFRDAVTRAGQKANTLAVIAFRSGLTEQKVTEQHTETFSETRLSKSKDEKGNPIPFTYVKTTVKNVNKVMPRDWRAGMAWLERRDPDNWSARLEVLIGVKADLLKELKAKADAAGVELSTIFEEMVNELGEHISAGTGQD